MKKLLLSFILISLVSSLIYAATVRLTAQCDGGDGVSYVVAESEDNYVTCAGYGQFYNSSVIVSFTSAPGSSSYETRKIDIVNGTSGKVKVANYVIYNLSISNTICH